MTTGTLKSSKSINFSTIFVFVVRVSPYSNFWVHQLQGSPNNEKLNGELGKEFYYCWMFLDIILESSLKRENR